MQLAIGSVSRLPRLAAIYFALVAVVTGVQGNFLGSAIEWRGGLQRGSGFQVRLKDYFRVDLFSLLRRNSLLGTRRTGDKCLIAGDDLISQTWLFCTVVFVHLK